MSSVSSKSLIKDEWSDIQNDIISPCPLAPTLTKEEWEYWFNTEMQNQQKRKFAYLFHQFVTCNLLSLTQFEVEHALERIIQITPEDIAKVLLMTPMNTIEESLGKYKADVGDLIRVCVHDMRTAKWAITHLTAEQLKKLEKPLLMYMSTFKRDKIAADLEETAHEYGLNQKDISKDQIEKADYLRTLAWRSYFNDQREVIIRHSERHDFTHREIVVIANAANKTPSLVKIIFINFFLDRRGISLLQTIRKEIDISNCHIQQDFEALLTPRSGTPIDSLSSLSSSQHERAGSGSDVLVSYSSSTLSPSQPILPFIQNHAQASIPRTVAYDQTPQSSQPHVEEEQPVPNKEIEKPKKTSTPWYSHTSVKAGLVAALVSITAFTTYAFTKKQSKN